MRQLGLAISRDAGSQRNDMKDEITRLQFKSLQVPIVFSRRAPGVISLNLLADVVDKRHFS